MVKDMNEFTKSILPRMFKHSNFASFVRQLNKYDFHKVKNTEDNQFGEHVSAQSPISSSLSPSSPPLLFYATQFGNPRSCSVILARLLKGNFHSYLLNLPHLIHHTRPLALPPRTFRSPHLI